MDKNRYFETLAVVDDEAVSEETIFPIWEVPFDPSITNLIIPATYDRKKKRLVPTLTVDYLPEIKAAPFQVGDSVVVEIANNLVEATKIKSISYWNSSAFYRKLNSGTEPWIKKLLTDKEIKDNKIVRVVQHDFLYTLENGINVNYAHKLHKLANPENIAHEHKETEDN